MKRALVLGLLVAVGGAAILSASQPAADAPKVIEVEKVKDNLFVLRGGGGNTAVFVMANGVAVVDAKNPGWGAPILAKIKELTPKPVTLLINTHTHGDHVSGNVEFAGSVDVVVQENTKANMPDGTAYYQAMIEKFTTLKLTAKEIHEIGLKEVARLEAEMEATKTRAGFKGTMAEFFHFLRTDPQFYARTPRELLSYSAYVAKQADWKLAETVGVLPRRRHGIRPVPAAIAPIFTGGRGGLDACLMSTYNLPARPL